MALLRQHCGAVTPFRICPLPQREAEVIQSGSSGCPLLSTELQPSRSLSASHSCLNMSQDGGQCRIDVSILEALWLTTTTGQSNLLLKPRRLRSPRPPRLPRPAALVAFRRPPRRLFRGEEFETSSSHWWKWLSRWSEIDPLCSIQHRSDTATGRAGATPRGCAEIKAKIAGLRRRAFVRLPLLRVPQLLVERVAVVSPTLSRCKVG